ncbi:MAG TPA: hypothetical protein VHT72_00805, partial [Puia sp.]|nr:hypothetical protein [Puia sp.]
MIRMIIKNFLRVFLFFASLIRLSVAQITPPNPSLISLQHFVTRQQPRTYDTSFSDLHYLIGENINYLYPLYQLLGNGNKFMKDFSVPVYYDLLSQCVSFTGDYAGALEYQKMSDTTHLTDVEYRQIGKSIQQLKDIKNADAKRFITFIASNYKVIMLNEAINKPIHRAFAYSLLDVLYTRGYRYLAMEMLNPMPDHELTKLTYKTGHFATEPVAGELIRQALDLGFKLIAYQDPQGNSHTPTERDSIQALNIAGILKNDPEAKIFVYGSYGNIAENSTSPDFIPMGMAFKRMTGIDPLTIDQTDMTEESNFSFGKAFYDAYVEKYPITIASVPLINDEPVNITGTTLYDLTIIHPKTTYYFARPTWLALSNRRRPVSVKTKNQNIFLVQAYYEFESFGTKPGQVIPADQTYFSYGNGTY